MNAGRREDVSKKIRQGEWGVGLRIADCGLRIDKIFSLDFGSSVEQTHKSAIRNPQPAIRNPTPFLRSFDLACAALPNTLAFASRTRSILRKL